MGSIIALKMEVQEAKQLFKARMKRLQEALCAEYPIKVGDLLEIREGTYGDPIMRIYKVSRIVFDANDEAQIFGYKRLKDGETFHPTEKRVFPWNAKLVDIKSNQSR